MEKLNIELSQACGLPRSWECPLVVFPAPVPDVTPRSFRFSMYAFTVPSTYSRKVSVIRAPHCLFRSISLMCIRLKKGTTHTLPFDSYALGLGATLVDWGLRRSIVTPYESANHVS